MRIVAGILAGCIITRQIGGHAPEHFEFEIWPTARIENVSGFRTTLPYDAGRVTAINAGQDASTQILK